MSSHELEVSGNPAVEKPEGKKCDANSFVFRIGQKGKCNRVDKWLPNT